MKKEEMKMSKLLKSVLPEKAFYVCDGSVFNNLRELSDGLKRMSDESFSQHVNTEKNDFHNWIRDVFQEAKLANSVLKTTRLEMARKINARLKK